MQVLGYRHHEVAGISPWTVIEGGPLDETNFLCQAHRYAYQHLAAYCLNYDRRFFSGEPVRRRVEVFNDVMEPSDLTLECRLVLDEEVVDRQVQRVKLGPAGHQILDVDLKVPRRDQRTPLQWRLTLERNGEVVFDDTHHYAVFPRSGLPPLDATVGLYDPKGTTRKLFEEAGLRTIPVKRLASLDPQLDVLVIGAGTLTRGESERPIIGRVLPAGSSRPCKPCSDDGAAGWSTTCSPLGPSMVKAQNGKYSRRAASSRDSRSRPATVERPPRKRRRWADACSTATVGWMIS